MENRQLVNIDRGKSIGVGFGGSPGATPNN